MGGRVLIVEDEPDIRDLLAFHLEREGYHVTRSRTGADALRQVRARPAGPHPARPDAAGARRARRVPAAAPGSPHGVGADRDAHGPRRGGRPHPRARARRRRLHRQAVLSEGGRRARARRAASGERPRRRGAGRERPARDRSRAPYRPCRRGRNRADPQGVRFAAGARRGAGPRALAGVPPRPGVGLRVGGRDRVADRRRPRAAAAHEARRRGPAHHHREGCGLPARGANDARHRPRHPPAHRLQAHPDPGGLRGRLDGGGGLLSEPRARGVRRRVARAAPGLGGRRRRGRGAGPLARRRRARGGPGLRLARGAPDGRARHPDRRRRPRRRGIRPARRRPGAPRQSPGSPGGPDGARGPPRSRPETERARSTRRCSTSPGRCGTPGR